MGRQARPRELPIQTYAGAIVKRARRSPLELRTASRDGSPGSQPKRRSLVVDETLSWYVRYLLSGLSPPSAEEEVVSAVLTAPSRSPTFRPRSGSAPQRCGSCSTWAFRYCIRICEISGNYEAIQLSGASAVQQGESVLGWTERSRAP